MVCKHAESYRSTVGSDPYGFYESLRQRGEVVWDEEMRAWLVTSFEACKHLLQNDEVKFRHPFIDMNAEAFIAISGGPRDIKLLHGPDHDAMHRWYVQTFSARNVAAWRAQIVKPIVTAAIERIAGQGTVELHGELSARVPTLVLAALMGLPWQDEAWIARAKALMNEIAVFFDNLLRQTEEMIRAARAASDELNAMLLPFVEERRSGQGSDIISLLWRDGPRLLKDWSANDVIANCRVILFGGSDTTMHSITNSCYLLLTQPGLMEQVRAGGEETAARFVEEMLRLYGSVQFRPRIAAVDSRLGEAEIRKGDMTVALISAADRDPGKYAHPAEIDFTRKVPRDHLAFNTGPRHCVGALLARAELVDVVQAVTERLPHMKLDPEREPPSMQGFLLRSFRPLHVRL